MIVRAKAQTLLCPSCGALPSLPCRGTRIEPLCYDLHVSRLVAAATLLGLRHRARAYPLQTQTGKEGSIMPDKKENWTGQGTPEKGDDGKGIAGKGSDVRPADHMERPSETAKAPAKDKK